MTDKKYEEMLPYTSMLLKWIDLVGIAIINGNTGSIELSMVNSYLTSDLKNPIEEKMKDINEMYDQERNEMLKSWTVPYGFPGDGQTRVVMTISKQKELNRLEALANQMRVNVIMDALHKNGMLLTNSISMPTSVVG